MGQAADVGKASEREPGADEHGKKDPNRVAERSEGRAGKHDEPRPEAPLPFERPAVRDRTDRGQARVDPGLGPLFDQEQSIVVLPEPLASQSSPFTALA